MGALSQGQGPNATAGRETTTQTPRRGRIRSFIRRFSAIAAVLAWSGLTLQFYFTTHRSIAWGRGLLGGLTDYFSYFTILTNFLVAIALTARLVRRRYPFAQVFARPGITTGIAASIAVTSIAYNWLLRSLWDPKGLLFVADLLLHQVTPALFLIYWWLSLRSSAEARWDHALRWSLYPTGYFIYIMTRGELSGVYPYPFIDASRIGLGRALANGVGILIGFTIIALLLVAVARLKSPGEVSALPQRVPQRVPHRTLR